MENKDRIIGLLRETNRDGMDRLIRYLTRSGFFVSPASRTHHGCFKGGLAAHSLRLYELVMFHSGLKLGDVTSQGQKPLPITYENIVIAPLLHDVCKIDSCVRRGQRWIRNSKRSKGHAILSIERIAQHIKLDPIEEMMIRFHMGVYGCYDFHKKGSSAGEYPLRGDSSKSPEQRYGKSLGNVWNHNPICKLVSICDELATMEEKAAKQGGARCHR